MTDKELKEQKKLDSQQRLVTQRTINGLLSQFSFKNVKTWNDVYVRVGYSSEHIKDNYTNVLEAVDLASLKAYCFKMKEEVEERIRKKYEVSTISDSNTQSISESKVRDSGVEKDKTNIDGERGTILQPTVVQPTTPQPAHFQPAQAVSPTTSEVDESGFNNSNDYGLWPSVKERAFLFWFQKKSVKDALDKVL